MKRLHLTICVFGLILSASGTATANTWQVVYQTDFSSDPGWITDQPANYYWDAASQTYHIQPEHHYPGYQPSRYAYKLLDEPVAGSFELRWDIKITRCDWSIGIYFGIYDSNLSFYGYPGLQLHYILGGAGNPDAGHLWVLIVGGAGGYAEIPGGGTWEFNQWYTCTLTYDAGTNMASFEVKNRDTRATMWKPPPLSMPGGLTNDLKFLGSTGGGVGDNGTYPGIDPWAVAEAYIDNVVLSVPGETPSAFLDDFEDGVIDTSLWVTHGYKGGVGGVGAGGWQYSFNECTAEDGYIQARVWGPPSGNTYGAEAWIRTTKNFNDGQSWLVNFTWETTVGYLPNDSSNLFAIQITDGGTRENCNWFWPFNEPLPGSVNLWHSMSDPAPGWGGDQPRPPFSKTIWSVVIDPTGFALLYQSPNATGTPYCKVTLDSSKEWYLRFIMDDATSAGYAAGDNTLKLYHFAARTLEEGTPPIADAGDDLVADANEQVTLDGSGSSDPDGQIIKYAWKRLPDGVVIYSGPEPTCQTKALGRVEEVIELTVTDDSLATATDTLRIISRTTQQLKDQLATLQSQIEQLQQQQQETRSLVDRICSYPPIKWWLRRAIKLGDLNGDGEVDMSDFALFTKGWLH
jgi:hypothetical protein